MGEALQVWHCQGRMMDRERLYRTEAIVLKRSDFFESDRLLILYTPNLGKIRAIAKGVRKPTSRKGGHVELFTHSQLLIAKGRNLDIVTQAETIHPFLPLREDLLRITHAYYAAELIDRFTEERVENRPLFELLLSVLGWIGEASDLSLVMRLFELHLLGYVGYRPQLFRCARCEARIEPVANFFSPEDGGVLCPPCGEAEPQARSISLNALKALRFLQTRDYAICQRLRISEKLHGELEMIMHGYITHILGMDLKAAAFLDRLRREVQV